MRLAASDLLAFWEAAARPVPVMIIGGGRWGRVWASVLTAARGRAAATVIVARRNLAETRDWVNATPALRGIEVAGSIASALDLDPRPQIAIIASRPRDHVRDALEALSGGAHLLVEKPIASKAADASVLIDAAARAGRLLGVGTEFAFLPAFHHLASLTGRQHAASMSVELEWSDPRDEIRHGASKAVHEETTVLDDLMPHALSIFRVLNPSARLVLATSDLAPGARRGEFRLRDQNQSSYRLVGNAEDDRRRRLLRVVSGDFHGSVDFSAHPPQIRVGDDVVELPDAVLSLDSTLRLELGAFLAESAGLVRTSPLTTGLHEMVALHSALEAAE